MYLWEERTEGDVTQKARIFEEEGEGEECGMGLSQVFKTRGGGKKGAEVGAPNTQFEVPRICIGRKEGIQGGGGSRSSLEAQELKLKVLY